MIMETLSCGYPVTPSGLGATPLMTPPSTPPDSDSFGHDCSPQLYAQTQFTQPGYSASQLHNDPYNAKFEEDANNNNHIYTSDKNNNEDSILSSGLSSLNISESEDRYSDLSPVSETSEDDFMSRLSQSPPPALSSAYSRSKSNKKHSRSKSKISRESMDGDKSRKDSFVYDVRLPDEQFLFLVPDIDLVKSHLMFAVREEVDVLKDKIVELMDRIKHLECENTILRQYASPEVLQQLQSQLPHALSQPPHHSSTS